MDPRRRDFRGGAVVACVLLVAAARAAAGQHRRLAPGRGQRHLDGRENSQRGVELAEARRRVDERLGGRAATGSVGNGMAAAEGIGLDERCIRSRYDEERGAGE